MPFFLLSVGREGVQPAAELQHLKRHKHGLHVPSALFPPCPAPNLQSRPPLHAACAAVVHRLLPPDPCTSPRTACSSFDSRQRAAAFNQPLSFNTASVTNMGYMFNVRSVHALAPLAFTAGPSRRAC